MGGSQSGIAPDPTKQQEAPKQIQNFDSLLKQNNTNYTDAPVDSTMVLSQLQLQEIIKINQFNPGKMEKSCMKANVYLDTSQLIISGQKSGKRYKLDSQIVTVPFHVIMASMDGSLKKSFHKLAPQMEKQYSDQQQQHWKLHGNGYYINYELGHIICIITNTTIYKGVLLNNKQNQIVPEENGTLIDAKGIYIGEFKNGRAHGQGTYTERQTETKFSGRWQDGKLAHGTIQNKTFKYTGDMKNGFAEGKGAVKFYKTGSSYIGCFQKGWYHSIKDIRSSDIGHLDKFETDDYIYTGEFQKGMKHGKGELNQKKKVSRIKKKDKYRPADDYKGDWVEDYYVTTRDDKQKKKLQDIQANQRIGMDIIGGTTEYKENAEKSQRTSDFQGYNLDGEGAMLTPEQRLKLKNERRVVHLLDKVVQTIITDNQVPQYVAEQEIRSEL